MAFQNTPKVRQALQKVILDSYAQVKQLWDTLVTLEMLHDITKQWLPSSPKWKEAVLYMEVRDYQKVLDKLEGLVVQHFFELTKVGHAGTGKFTH